jgi:2-amino-4-hydroxy-6-hydroxymethyldihydropteridine diphosphokinase
LKIAYLALGSNLGNRGGNLEDAVERLGSPQLSVLRLSSIYETEPRDVVNQPWFLNQVIEAETSLFPRQLRERVRKIERELGRKPTSPKGPRLIDIDILLFGAAIVSTPELEIPHPRMAERRFVLEPLAELVPELRHPITRRTVREMLAQVKDQPVRLLMRKPHQEGAP